MAQDRHLGRVSPAVTVEANPDTFNRLITTHGLLSRIMRSRKCPCVTITGSPSIACNTCHGDGYIYDFQRKLLEVDEDSDIKGEQNIVHPFRVPILEPLRVERLLPEEAGGIKEYTIDSFNSDNITISGDPLPTHYHEMRVSYYFDRYEKVVADRVKVYPSTKTLVTTQTRFNGAYRNSNVTNAHGDLAIITRIYDLAQDHTYTNYTFRKNIISLGSSEPTPTENSIEVDYFYVPVSFVLAMDLESMTDKEKWTSNILSGDVRMAVKHWFELSEGDLITVLSSEFYQDAIITKSTVGYDKLNEFDIVRLDDEIIDENGAKYRKNVDYYLRPFREIVWFGAQPNAGLKYSVRFSYRPTYKIFMKNPVPNNLENKNYPKVFFAKSYSMTLPKDIETGKNPEYNPNSSESTSVPSGFTSV